MEAENEKSQGERGGTEMPSSTQENEPPIARLPDLSPEKDPMGTRGKITPPNRAAN